MCSRVCFKILVLQCDMLGSATAEVISLNQLSPSCVISPGREYGSEYWTRLLIVYPPERLHCVCLYGIRTLNFLNKRQFLSTISTEPLNLIEKCCILAVKCISYRSDRCARGQLLNLFLMLSRLRLFTPSWQFYC